ncbi:hypothetical protein OH809_39805 [Streptomyces sp. NBC_00873]|uniref:hypothetical protein n=1 Tax=unclassified Streptomyces TaxID=2593676 RepID=UPI00386AD059|nr:hypothetical protein OH809_39805 [Streptomyces sp. NBC_00873]WTA41893.1 hypothetical protein OH821_03890 [Streptomyces sp. NBC_00842]
MPDEGIRAGVPLPAPSTLGTFLRSFTHGKGLQLHAVHRKVLAELAAFYSADVVAACRHRRTHFSITCGMTPSIQRAIASFRQDA